MHDTTRAAVQRSWTQLEPIAAQAAALFYRHLFDADPALRVLFKGDLTEQRERLMQIIGLAVRRLDAPEQLLPQLRLQTAWAQPLTRRPRAPDARPMR